MGSSPAHPKLRRSPWTYGAVRLSYVLHQSALLCSQNHEEGNWEAKTTTSPQGLLVSDRWGENASHRGVFLVVSVGETDEASSVLACWLEKIT